MSNPVGGTYPMRTLVRHKAKAQLIIGVQFQANCPALDEDLLRDLATTLFRSQQGQELYQPYSSRHEADAIENRFANKLVATYQQIKQRQADPLIQRLQQLLPE